MSRPNLFEFATSELSQDAVLCWLASWAGPEAAGSDPHLTALGREFLAALFRTHARELPESDLWTLCAQAVQEYRCAHHRKLAVRSVRRRQGRYD